MTEKDKNATMVITMFNVVHHYEITKQWIWWAKYGYVQQWIFRYAKTLIKIFVLIWWLKNKSNMKTLRNVTFVAFIGNAYYGVLPWIPLHCYSEHTQWQMPCPLTSPLSWRFTVYSITKSTIFWEVMLYIILAD